MNRFAVQQLTITFLLATVVLLGMTTPAFAQCCNSANIFESGALVGIGTPTPQQKLDVNGRIRMTEGTNAAEFFAGSSGGVTGFHLGSVTNVPIAFYTNSSAPLMLLDTQGRLGVGVTAPAARLEVLQNMRVSYGGNALDIYRGTLGGVNGFLIGSVTSMPVGIITNNTLAAVVDAAGNVGIGTSAPVAKMHVAGNAQIDGNIAAKYQDVAEWVKAPRPLSPGTVVTIDTTEPNSVVPVSRAYDTAVAGVVSAQPGVLLGEGGSNREKIAHSGRVKVKVDARYGPIAIGDLLVASSTPGYAMVSTPIKIGETLLHRPGTLVGKALEPLAEGEGEILVLLTLQ